jgi:hypothetical protein
LAVAPNPAVRRITTSKYAAQVFFASHPDLKNRQGAIVIYGMRVHGCVMTIVSYHEAADEGRFVVTFFFGKVSCGRGS